MTGDENEYHWRLWLLLPVLVVVMIFYALSDAFKAIKERFLSHAER